VFNSVLFSVPNPKIRVFSPDALITQMSVQFPAHREPGDVDSGMAKLNSDSGTPAAVPVAF
jgi:hypothetical protein